MKDYLSRQPYLNLLKSIIGNQKNNETGYYFAIDGEWGSGKTWVLQELEKQLLEDKDNKYLIFHYNAWENDFYEEPLVAILSVMIECLKKQKTRVKEKDSAKKVVTSSITALIKVAGTVIEKKWNVNPNDIIESVKDSGKAISDIKLTKSDFNNMLPLENALKQIKNVIEKLSKEMHIILVVDELDRCLPEYAIKVLERLHHVCDGMAIIQIIAYSGKALANSVAQVYCGNLLDEQTKKAYCSHYMEKFVNLILPLNFGITDTNINKMFEGVEQSFRPIFDESNDFLINFYNLFLRDIPIRNRKKILQTVKMIHELTLATNEFANIPCTYELLCSEIILVIDRVLLHAQNPLDINFTENRQRLTLSFNGNESSRYGELISFKTFERMIERISVSFNKEEIPGSQKEFYQIYAASCSSIVFLILAHGDNIQILSEYSYLLAMPSQDIVIQSKKFIIKFYELLYQIL